MKLMKIVHVCGRPDTGKTAAIQRFLEDRGLFETRHKGEVLAIFRIKKGGHQIVIGAASMGDNLRDVQGNIDFLGQRKCDVMVLTSRAPGTVTFREVENWAQQHKAIRIEVCTRHIADEDEHDAEEVRVANRIQRAI